MKKQLLALSLIASSALAAQDACSMTDTGACVENTCYTPQYYDLPCNCGFYVYGEFLYWLSREINLPIGIRVATVPNSPTGNATNTDFSLVAKEYFHLDIEYQPGFRIGVGYNSSCDGWDYFLNWTYYRGRSSRKTPNVLFSGSFPGVAEEAILSLWSTQSFFSGIDAVAPFYNQVTANWRLEFNQVDLELGRRYWLSDCFSMRPFTGVRGARTRTVFEIDSVSGSQLTPPFKVFTNSVYNLRNRTWGVGMLAGIQPNWYFSRTCRRTFSFYGDLRGALLWGEFEGRPKESHLFAFGTTIVRDLIDIDTTAVESYFKMSPIVDLGIGFQWEQFWCSQSIRSTLDIGWEHHIWFQHGQYHRSFGASNIGGGGAGAVNLFVDSIDTEHNLAYGGPTFSLKLEF